jgi:hypothetical protein
MRRFLAMAITAVSAMTLVIPMGSAPTAVAYPRIDKTELLLFGDNPGALDPNDASGVGTLGRERCVTTGEPGSVPGVDKDVSCDDTFAPDNENGIVVHPGNPNILLGGSNDYQLFFNGRTVVQRVPAGYFLSMDGGQTWVDGQVPMQASFGAGDPSPAFNTKFNTAHMASLSFVCGQGAPVCSRGNLAVATLKLDQVDLSNPSNPVVPWNSKMVVNGSAADVAAVQIFSDKEWLVVDNWADSPHYGNMYLVYARFRSEHAAYDESPIFFTKSEDGGSSWTDPVEISGRSLTRCTFQDDPDDSVSRTGDFNPSGVSETPDDPNACDQDQFAYPAVAPDGTLYVHFHNEQHLAAYELPQKYDSQIMIVKSNDGGDSFYGDLNPAEQAGCVPNPLAAPGMSVTLPGGGVSSCIVPIAVVDLEDSYDRFEHPAGIGTPIPDYPINVSGRTTLTNMQFRVNSAGTIAIAPAAGETAGDYRIYVVFADNCAGTRPAPGQSQPPAPGAPFTSITDTNLYYAYSDNGGQTWHGGDGPRSGRPINSCSLTGSLATSGRLIANTATAAGDDQWFPWIDAHRQTGAVVAVTMDANQFDGSAVRETYGFTAFTTGPTVLGTPPTFSAAINLAGAPSTPRQSRFFRAQAPACFDCATFIGDYNGTAYASNGMLHGMWTDMRRALALVNRPPGCDDNPATPAPPCVPVQLTGQDAYYAKRPVTP